MMIAALPSLFGKYGKEMVEEASLYRISCHGKLSKVLAKL